MNLLTLQSNMVISWISKSADRAGGPMGTLVWFAIYFLLSSLSILVFSFNIDSICSRYLLNNPDMTSKVNGVYSSTHSLSLKMKMAVILGVYFIKVKIHFLTLLLDEYFWYIF